VDYTAAIIDNIEEHRADGRPFFACLAMQAPHDPFRLPDDWRDRHAGRYDDGYDALRAARIERMKTLGILDPEATVFPRLPGVPARAQAGAGPLRMFKGFRSEGGIRVPAIVAGHGVQRGARIADSLTHLMDIPATILEVAGVPYPDTRDGKPVPPLLGKSLTPIPSGESDAVRGPADRIGWVLFGNRAVRMGDWKLVSLCAPYGAGDWQLSDLKADPGETHDLAAERPEIRDEILRHWDDYAATHNVIIPDMSPICQPAN